MSHLPPPGYISDAARDTAEQKQAFEDLRDAIGEGFGQAEMVELTIAAGSVTPTQTAHSIDTEADAGSDDLTHVDQGNMPDGAIVIVRCEDNARNVVVNHGAGGAGQILLADAVDMTLVDTTQWLMLQRFGTSWSEILRSYGNQKATFRTHWGLGTVAVLDTGAAAGQVSLNDQAFDDVASATTTDIGAATSWNVRITGTTTITGLGTVAAGIIRRVRFADALILTHNGTSLILPSTANITTATDDTAEFISLGSGDWICMSYKRADGTAVVAPSGIDVQTLTADGDWTKPVGISADSEVLIQVWGPGASGGSRTTAGNATAGGGGGYAWAIVRAGDLGATVSCTVPVGGVGVSGNSDGNDGGGNVLFGTLVEATFGIKGTNDDGSTGENGGVGGQDVLAVPGGDYEGASSSTTEKPGMVQFGGGAGGGCDNVGNSHPGGDSRMGSAGGGAATDGITGSVGGSSLGGADGGAGNEAGSATDGDDGGGGGGGSIAGTSGAGGDARIIVTTRPL